MDDPLDIPYVPPSEHEPEFENTGASDNERLLPDPDSFPLNDTPAAVRPAADLSAPQQRTFEMPRSVYYKVSRDISYDAAESRRRNFRQNLSLLLALTLAAFTLTIWILVRVESPFGIFSTGPQEIVRAHLRALDRGDLRPAYDMLSARYREQVSFDDWHELVVTHRRIFHAEILGTEMPSNSGSGITLEIYLHSANDKDYRALFKLIRTDGRWWIDDVHWSEEPDERNVSRT